VNEPGRKQIQGAVAVAVYSFLNDEGLDLVPDRGLRVERGKRELTMGGKKFLTWQKGKKKSTERKSYSHLSACNILCSRKTKGRYALLKQTGEGRRKEDREETLEVVGNPRFTWGRR